MTDMRDKVSDSPDPTTVGVERTKVWWLAVSILEDWLGLLVMKRWVSRSRS
jgi:hypothetical protein